MSPQDVRLRVPVLRPVRSGVRPTQPVLPPPAPPLTPRRTREIVVQSGLQALTGTLQKITLTPTRPAAQNGRLIFDLATSVDGAGWATFGPANPGKAPDPELHIRFDLAQTGVYMFELRVFPMVMPAPVTYSLFGLVKATF